MTQFRRCMPHHGCRMLLYFLVNDLADKGPSASNRIRRFIVCPPTRFDHRPGSLCKEANENRSIAERSQLLHLVPKVTRRRTKSP